MAGNLSFLQEQALIALHRRQHFGLDSRAVRGLIVRGLVRLGYYNATFPSMPFLTEAGAPIAAELDAADKWLHFERRVRGTRFAVIDGGRAI